MGCQCQKGAGHLPREERWSTHQQEGAGHPLPWACTGHTWYGAWFAMAAAKDSAMSLTAKKDAAGKYRAPRRWHSCVGHRAPQADEKPGQGMLGAARQIGRITGLQRGRKAGRSRRGPEDGGAWWGLPRRKTRTGSSSANQWQSVMPSRRDNYVPSTKDGLVPHIRGISLQQRWTATMTLSPCLPSKWARSTSIPSHFILGTKHMLIKQFRQHPHWCNNLFKKYTGFLIFAITPQCNNVDYG